MSPGTRRLVGQLIVLIPVLLVSWALGRIGMALVPRFGIAIGVGMILIMAVALWERRHRE